MINKNHHYSDNQNYNYNYEIYKIDTLSSHINFGDEKCMMLTSNNDTLSIYCNGTFDSIKLNSSEIKIFDEKNLCTIPIKCIFDDERNFKELRIK